MSKEKERVSTMSETSERNDETIVKQPGAFLSPEDKKAVLVRFSKAIGHLQSVKRMVENDSDVEKTLVQLSAVRSALYGVARSLIQGVFENQFDRDKENREESIPYLSELAERYLQK